MAKEKIGVLVMAYGTPASLDDVESYYTHIRRGNPPTPEKLQELVDRYQAIGGLSPLLEITRDQVNNMEERLNEKSPHEFVAYMGMKHAAPFIDDAIKKMAEDGIKRAIGIVLAPHYSMMSVGAYHKTAIEAAQTYGVELLSLIKDYHLNPDFIQALVNRVEEVLKKFPGNAKEEVKVLFTAHSLPEKILEMNDPYPTQLRETAEVIAQRVGLENWETGWQSAGQTAVPWLGPDILERMVSLQKEGVKQVLICPIGFVSDHLEVLYDIDIECQKLAKELGIHLERTASLNADPLYMECLSNVILQELPKT